jgi:glycine betaine/proline transport system substrate-binding protein
MRKFLIAILIVALSAGMAFAEGSQEQGGMEQPDRGNVELVYVEWARATAITNVAAAVMEQLGWSVDVTSVANAAMWASVANGDSDALLCAWLPATHAPYYGDEGEYTDEVVDLGPNYTGASLGLVVPSYVEEDSIPELANAASKYESTIVGIDPGAGMMQQTEAMIENDTYGMGDWTLVEGSGATMVAALADAIDNEEPIVVTGWAPHVKFARFDLKILDDPQNVFGESETINTVVRQGLEEEQPELYEFLSNMDWPAIEDAVIGRTMVLVSEGMDADDAAEQVVSENVDAINSALPEGFQM